MGNDARTAMLLKIEAALGRSASAMASAEEELSIRNAAWEELPRNYAKALVDEGADCVDLLEGRLRDYDAEVSRVSEGEIAEEIARILRARGNQLTLLAGGFPVPWTPPEATLVAEPTEPLTPWQLDRFDGVVTGATLAIAETGTLVLQSGPGQGRRATTLVPDFHLCVVRECDVVSGVPEAFARLQHTSTLPTTFVSGPSATADIEMTRVKGVHGPRFLHVLLVRS